MHSKIPVMAIPDNLQELTGLNIGDSAVKKSLAFALNDMPEFSNPDLAAAVFNFLADKFKDEKALTLLASTLVAVAAIIVEHDEDGHTNKDADRAAMAYTCGNFLFTTVGVILQNGFDDGNGGEDDGPEPTHEPTEGLH